MTWIQWRHGQANGDLLLRIQHGNRSGLFGDRCPAGILDHYLDRRDTGVGPIGTRHLEIFDTNSIDHEVGSLSVARIRLGLAGTLGLRGGDEERETGAALERFPKTGGASGKVDEELSGGARVVVAKALWFTVVDRWGPRPARPVARSSR